MPSIPGLTGAGNSSALSSLLSAASSVPNVPQVEYQDLGLTMKSTPRVMRNNEVALSIDLKIDALSGTSLNGNPILDNRAYSGVVMVKDGEGVVVVTELDKSEMPYHQRRTGHQRDTRPERRDRQRYPDQLCNAVDRDDAAHRSRIAIIRPLADDADR